MADYKYGEIKDWNDVNISSGNSFMKLTQGDNRIRIITPPYQFHVCWLQDVSGAKVKLRSALKNCPLIKRGEKIQTRWFIGVINRKTGNTEVLEIGAQVLTGVRTLANEPDWGNPIKKYDINIKRGRPGDNPLYHVVGIPPKPLTKEEEDLINVFLENNNLSKLTEPPTVEEVESKLAEIEGKSSGDSGGGGSSKEDKAEIDDTTFNFDETL